MRSRWIGSNTFHSLQIIQHESHPNLFNQGPGIKSSSSKEGLSIYGLFQRFAHSPQGRSKLKQIFIRPSLDLKVISQRHNFIEVFSRPDNQPSLDKMTKAMKHIKNLRPVMTNLHKGISTGSARITGFKTTVWACLLAVSIIAHRRNIAYLSSLRSIRSISSLLLGRRQAQKVYLHGRRFELQDPLARSLVYEIQALEIFETAQLYNVGRMIQEVVSETPTLTQDPTNSTGRHRQLRRTEQNSREARPGQKSRHDERSIRWS